MATCASCNERLYDYVYGLLEGPDLDQMREHLRSCASCQVDFEKAQTHQNLMAMAAKAITIVPEFAPPTDAPTAPVQAPASAAPLPATLPLTAAAPKSKRWYWSPVAAWSAAAAI